MLLSLTAISLGASAILAAGYAITKEPIDKAAALKEEKAIKEVLPDGVSSIGEAKAINIDGLSDSFPVYPASKDGEFVGAAVQTYSNEGYSGRITIMVGFDRSGSIINYSVLSAAETPGLGAKVIDWFKNDQKPKADIRGKNPQAKRLSVSKDGGEIDAITASTITSRAFLQSINNAYEAFAKYKKDNSIQ